MLEDTKGEKSLVVNLFDDVTFQVKTATVSEVSNGIINWQGQEIHGESFEISFMVKEGTIVGRIHTSAGLFRIAPAGEFPWHAITRINPSQFPEESPTRHPFQESRDMTEMSQEETLSARLCDAKGPTPGPGKGPRIHIMVLYTPAVRTASPGIDQEIALAMQELGGAFEGTWFQAFPLLAHSQEIAYTETNDMNRDLDWVTTDGTVAALRNTHKADLVVLLTEQGQYCGIGWAPNPVVATSQRYGFSVTLRSCLSNMTFPHEIGHNLGMFHDRYVENAPDPNGYNFGYVNLGIRLRSIMAYDRQCTDAGTTCNRVLAYSEPYGLYKGQNGSGPLGSPIGQPNPAHNRETFCRHAGTVSLFRR